MGLLYFIILYYIVRSEGMKMHAGVTLATECIQSFSNGSSRADSASLSSVQNIRRIGVGMGSDSSRFQVYKTLYLLYHFKIHATCLFTLHLKLQLSMISRQSYKSTVTGMLSVSSNEKSQKRLLDGFCDGLFIFFFLSF